MARTDGVLVSDDLLPRFPPIGDVKSKKPISALGEITDVSSSWLIFQCFAPECHRLQHN